MFLSENLEEEELDALCCLCQGLPRSRYPLRSFGRNPTRPDLMTETDKRAAIIVVHGGAGAWASDRLPAGVRGCELAAETGSRALEAGALAAVVAAVKVLEEDPLFNAGVGTTLTREGTVELDAAVMTGDLRFGAVGACPPVASAIELALRVLESGEHSLLVGDGALRFADESGVPRRSPEELITEWTRRRFEEAKGSIGGSGGTVGAVALDGTGSLAAATSTGGIANKRPGRVGDTPLVGAGTYADEVSGGAASATGHGEAIMRVLLCREAVGRLGTGIDVEEAGRGALDVFFRRAQGRGGLILLDRHGKFFTGRNTEAMPWAACRPGEFPTSGL